MRVTLLEYVANVRDGDTFVHDASFHFEVFREAIELVVDLVGELECVANDEHGLLGRVDVLRFSRRSTCWMRPPKCLHHRLNPTAGKYLVKV